MKVSSKGRYALRCMLDLVVNGTGDHVALHHIAERQHISLLYLEQVFSALRKAGLVKSVKGAGGGYALAYSPKCISIGDVLRAVEGDTSIIRGFGLTEEGEGVHNPLERCIREQVWQEVDKTVNNLINSIDLEQLAEQAQKHYDQNAMMFYI